MAGIGFELQKMFKKKGILSVLKAYGYAGIVCTGPMLLGVALLLGIRFLADLGGASDHEAELLNSMVTYTLLVSMVLSNALALVTTRYTADQLYMEKPEKVMPSFWGGIGIILVIGGVGYGVFLLFAGIPLAYQLLCLLFFGELTLVWTEITYLTAIKDYKGIILTFAVSLVIAWVCGYLFLLLPVDKVLVLMLAVCIGYGVMAVWYYVLLVKYFPQGASSSLSFLEWHNRYPQLIWLGLFISFGLFGHLVIMWTSDIRVQVQGLFYGAPMYDISALLAFLSILVTTINFVTSVEVNFYPKYRNYFSLFNDGGSFMDIEQAEAEMKATLAQKLTYTFSKQFFATIVFIIGGTLLLPKLPLGMNEDMLGIFRVLCVGYAFYAAGNCTMLILLYFADNRDALISVAVFAIVSCVGTAVLRNQNLKLAGVGFLAGSVCFCLLSLFFLWRYLKKIMYHVLCNQPIVQEEVNGKMKDIAARYQERYEEKYPDLEVEEDEE